MDSKTNSESLDKFVSIIGDISQRILETNEPARIKKISALRSCSTDEGEVCIKTFFEVCKYFDKDMLLKSTLKVRFPHSIDA